MECKINKFSSRVCERGTKSCDIRHDMEWIKVGACWALLLLLGIILFSDAKADDWTKADTIRQTTWTALHIADMGTTLDISRNCDKYIELNPILGKCPSQEKVVGFFLLTGWLHYEVSQLLSPKDRKIWQYITIANTGYWVQNNLSIGLKIEF